MSFVRAELFAVNPDADFFLVAVRLVDFAAGSAVALDFVVAVDPVGSVVVLDFVVATDLVDFAADPVDSAVVLDFVVATDLVDFAADPVGPADFVVDFDYFSADLPNIFY